MDRVQARTRSGGERILLRRSVWFWAAIALAIGVRVAFLADKAFWRDEAWVALLVGDPLQAATEGRAAPLGFLLLTRLVAAISPGPPEITYRLIPLAAGVAAVPLVARLALALGGSRAVALTAAWLAAGMQGLVYYSRELKSYDLDLLLALALPLLGLYGFAPDGDKRAPARRMFLVCVALAPWMTFGGIFAACGALAVGWFLWWPHADRATRREWLTASVTFAVSFAAVYELALSAQSTNSWMHSYWKGALLGGRGLALLTQIPRAAASYVEISTKYLFPGTVPFALALAILGAWRWPRAERPLLLLLYAAPAAFCVAAAVMDRYLLVHGRLLLFAAPIVILWVASGLCAAGRLLGRRAGEAVAIAAAALLATAWSAQAVAWRTGPYRTHQSEFFRYDVLQDMEAMMAKSVRVIPDGEPLLVSRKGAYAFAFYSRGRFPSANYCKRNCKDFRLRAKNWLAAASGRGWILMTDEEPQSFGELLDEAGFDHRLSVSTRGMRLWKIERKGEAGR